MAFWRPHSRNNNTEALYRTQKPNLLILLPRTAPSRSQRLMVNGEWKEGHSHSHFWTTFEKSSCNNGVILLALLRFVRNPYQTCAEMLSLLRTHTKQLKWTSKTQEINLKSSRKEDAWGVPGRWGGSPRLRGPAHPLSDCFSH